MAQIIKHRRGSVTQLKDVTARIGELVMATGSIGDLNGPFLFVGETEGAAGAYRPTSKIYQGSAAPTLTVGSHGSVLDGTPFYASGNESLYVLSKDGNSRLDLTGNIEGNLISGVTINNLTGSNANYTNLTGNTFTSTNANITSLTGSNANYTNLTGTTFTSTNSNITSLTGSNAFVTNITGGTLTVTGTTNLNGNLLISGNTIQTGSIDLTGNIVLGGNITIGDQTTDIIQFGGEVSSSIIPIVDNSFDLGSTNKNWRNLHVSGTAYINTLEAQQVNFNDLGILTDLSVSGSTYLGNGGDITVISGSLYNDQLTEKRLVVVGAQGLLTDYSGITFDNGNLNLSGALEVTNIQGTGSLYLKPDLNDSRDFRIYNTAPSDIHIKGNAAYSFFGDDTNYLKIDDNTGITSIVGVNGVDITGIGNVTNYSQSVDMRLTASVASVTALSSSISASQFTYSSSVSTSFSASTANVLALSTSVDSRLDTLEGTGTIQGVGTTNDVTFNKVTTAGDVIVGGDLVVQGNTVTLNTATLVVEDKLISLASGSTNAATANGAGIEVLGANATFTYDSTPNAWTANIPISASAFTGSFNLPTGGSSKRIAFRTTTGNLDVVTAPTTSGDLLQWNGTDFVMSNVIDGGTY